MSDLQLIEAVKIGNMTTVKEMIEAGVDINQQDEYGWTPLNWAAGNGNFEIISLLILNGADIFKVGRDKRTPYKIALAGGYVKVARYLHQVEDIKREGGESEPSVRLYCNAYMLKELRRFSRWNEIEINWKEHNKQNKNDAGAIHKEFSDEDIVFIHQDYSVTSLMWYNEDIIYNHVTPQWIDFCISVLGFKIPLDFDLIIPRDDN